MVRVLGFVVLSLIGADVSTEDQSSLLQAQAFQKRATADVVDRVALGALQSKSAGLEGATADKTKVEGATKGKVEGATKGKRNKKKSHHGYELLGEGSCRVDLEHGDEVLHKSQDKCIADCSNLDSCTGVTHDEGGLCQLTWNALRGWKQEASVCEHLAAAELARDSTCFHEVVSSSGAKCSDCEVVFSAAIEGFPSKEDALKTCDDYKKSRGGVYAELSSGRWPNICTIFFVKHEMEITKQWWDRAGSCYKKL